MDMRKNVVTIVLIAMALVGCAQRERSQLVSDASSKQLKEVRVGAACIEKYLPELSGRRVAVCGNQTSVVGKTHLVDTLLSLKVNVVKLFCPEHGFRGTAEAGAAIASGVDSQTGLPVVSLYGKNKKPTSEQLKDIDVVLFDLQDVGCRFYTYISTLHYVMEAAAENDVEVIVLDRPNPNGFYVDGPVLQPEFTSFVGMHPVPVVYGMTIGEYALMINGEGWLANNDKCRLQVVRIENYDHNTRYELPVSPSPNLQTPESVFLYPSLCLFEGTDVSVGRGTDQPFEMYGAPQFSAGDFYFTPKTIPGVSENPPHKNLKCRGFLLHDYAAKHIDENGCFDLQFLLNAYKYYPDKSKFFNKNGFFDKLAGNSQLRKQISDGLDEKEIRKSWQPNLERFKKIRENYLIYQ